MNPRFTPSRWRLSQGKLDRYGKGHPPGDDYPYAPGMLWDPYRQNMLKGDDPIHGQPPSLIDVPPGCAFHPRCRFADDRCGQISPELTTQTGPDHLAACLRADVVAGTLPPLAAR